MALDIFSLGDADMMVGALNAVAAFFQDDSFEQMLKIAMIVGLIMAAFQQLSGRSAWNSGDQLVQGPQYGPWSLIVPIIFAYISLLPKVDINVTNSYNGTVTMVSNVPMIIGAPMSIVSSIGQRIAERFELAFSTIPEARMTQSGFIDGIDTLNKLKMIDYYRMGLTFGPAVDLDQTIQRYYTDCVKIDLNSVYPPPSITKGAIEEAADLLDVLAAGSFTNLDTMVYLDKTKPFGEQNSCANAYQAIKNFFQGSDYQTAIDSTLKNNILKKRRDDATVSGLTMVSEASLASTGLATLNAGLMISNRLIKKSLSDAETQYAATMGSNAIGWALDVNQSKLNNGLQWKLDKELFMSYARPMMTFIEIISIAMAPLVPFLLLAGATRTLFGWIGTMVWVSLWPPIMSVINFYIMTKANADFTAQWDALLAAGKTQTEIFNYIHSMKGIMTIDNISNEWYAYANNLAASTPAIAAALLGGGMLGANSLFRAPHGKPEAVTAGITSQVGTGPGARINTSTGEYTTGAGGFYDKRLGQTFGKSSVGQQLSNINSYAQSDVTKSADSMTDEDAAKYVHANSSSNARSAYRAMGSRVNETDEHAASKMKKAVGQILGQEHFSNDSVDEVFGRLVEAIRAEGGPNTKVGKLTLGGAFESGELKRLSETGRKAIMKLAASGFENAELNKQLHSDTDFEESGQRIQDTLMKSDTSSHETGWKKAYTATREAAKRAEKISSAASNLNWSQEFNDQALANRVGGHDNIVALLDQVSSKFTTNGRKDNDTNYAKMEGMADPDRKIAAQIATLRQHIGTDPDARDALVAMYGAVSAIKADATTPKEQIDPTKNNASIEKADKKLAEGDDKVKTQNANPATRPKVTDSLGSGTSSSSSGVPPIPGGQGSDAGVPPIPGGGGGSQAKHSSQSNVKKGGSGHSGSSNAHPTGAQAGQTSGSPEAAGDTATQGHKGYKGWQKPDKLGRKISLGSVPDVGDLPTLSEQQVDAIDKAYGEHLELLKAEAAEHKKRHPAEVGKALPGMMEHASQTMKEGAKELGAWASDHTGEIAAVVGALIMARAGGAAIVSAVSAYIAKKGLTKYGPKAIGKALGEAMATGKNGAQQAAADEIWTELNASGKLAPLLEKFAQGVQKTHGKEVADAFIKRAQAMGFPLGKGAAQTAGKVGNPVSTAAASTAGNAAGTAAQTATHAAGNTAGTAARTTVNTAGNAAGTAAQTATNAAGNAAGTVAHTAASTAGNATSTAAQTVANAAGNAAATAAKGASKVAKGASKVAKGAGKVAKGAGKAVKNQKP